MSYHISLQHNGRSILEAVARIWMQHFFASNRIALRVQTGKLMVSPAKQEWIEKSVAFHMGVLKRGFQNGDINEDFVENADETHFVFNMDNGRTLGFTGDNDIKYADVFSGGESIAMMVRISGDRRASIHPPMIIFKNLNLSYPVRGVEDSVSGSFYRTSPKALMDGFLWQ